MKHIALMKDQEPEYVNAPITEKKLGSQLHLGMPFVINCNIQQLERIEELIGYI